MNRVGTEIFYLAAADLARGHRLKPTLIGGFTDFGAQQTADPRPLFFQMAFERPVAHPYTPLPLGSASFNFDPGP